MQGQRAVVEALSFGFRPDQVVLRDLSLAVSAGEIVGLLGRNGCGKTTFLRLLARLLRPRSGRIELAVRPDVVLDRTPFLEDLTAEENLYAVLQMRGRSGPASVSDVEQWLAKFQLSDDRRRTVREFSLGMRRRLALAEVFAAHPAMLLLDEPTLGLDPEGRRRLGSVLSEAGANGVAAVVASNDAPFVEEVCDRVVFLHGGDIVAEGEPRALIDALNAPTMVRVEASGLPAAADLPGGMSIMANGPDSLTLSATGSGRSVAELTRWLVDRGAELRSIRVDAPGLADVFASLTGERLNGQAGAADERPES